MMLVLHSLIPSSPWGTGLLAFVFVAGMIAGLRLMRFTDSDDES